MSTRGARPVPGVGWPWDVLLSAQAGVVTHAQAIDHSFSDRQIEFRVKSGKWRRIHWGIYAAFTGTQPRTARLWAAVLWAGRGAMLSHETAAELQELANRQSRMIHVTVPRSRRPTGKPMRGIIVHRSDQSHCDGEVPMKLPRTQIEDTVLDLAAAARTTADAYTWVSRAVANGTVSVGEIRSGLRRRKRFPGRQWLSDALADAADGAHFLLELRYARDVERAHGLPKGTRQSRRVIDGKEHHKDTFYEDYRICVELDGITYHRDRQHQDRHRDNVNLAVDDIRTFRFDIVDLTEGACQSAALVAASLRSQGWTGEPHPCRRPDCTVTTAFRKDRGGKSTP